MADVTFELTFDSGGFQQVLNSAGTRRLLDSHADTVVAKMGGLAYKRSFSATSYGYGPRPAVAVFSTKSNNPLTAYVARKRLEGAM
ncbi:MAG: hypothetical protein IJ092_00860 [Atopobiaceae bacterium]|nr:hypothetical protein [Atopobiaceae bacterium]